jgi:hypothetical protein
MPKSESVERFLATGEHDPKFLAWEGGLARRRRDGSAELAEILRRVVRWRSRDAPLGAPSAPRDAEAEVRARVGPMIAGLFEEKQAALLSRALPHRVEVVTVDRFQNGLRELPLDTQWILANMLLDELGAPPVSDAAPQLDGFCHGGRAWVLPRAFDVSEEPTDILVHEVAHLLHDLQWCDVTPRSKAAPLLSIAPRVRETWAYSAWARRDAPVAGSMPERIAWALDRRGLVDARVDRGRLRALLAVAAAAPAQGWATLRTALVMADPEAADDAPPETGRAGHSARARV